MRDLRDSHTNIDNSFEMQRKKSPIQYIGLFAILTVAGSVILLIAHQGSSSSSTKDVNVSDESSSIKTQNIININTETITSPKLSQGSKQSSRKSEALFTLKRTGYDALNYFNIDENSRSSENENVFLNYKFLENYTAIVEPSAEMELIFYDESSNVKDGYEYQYTVCSSSECQTGVYSKDSSATTTVKFACTPTVTEFDITISMTKTLEEEEEEEKVMQMFEGKALCFHVRREIHQLTDYDLNKFLDASYTLYKLSKEEGQKKYGPDFLDAESLLMLHHFNAVQQDSDHIHDGIGFLAQHIKFSNFFEAAIQVVDPSVTLPYWDFTLDVSKGNTLPHQSYVFSENIFGSITLPLDFNRGFEHGVDDITSAAIPNGRWAHLRSSFNKQFDDMKFGYGYMRAPWSMNPSPYVSRFVRETSNTLPTCESHFALLNTYDSLSDFMFKISFGPHATVHGTSGGTFGCNMLDDFVLKGDIVDQTAADKICAGMPFLFKKLYRMDIASPMNDCKLNTNDYSQSSCGFSCDIEQREEIGTRLKLWFSEEIDQSKGGSIDRMVDFICEGEAYKIFPGDNLESASPSDPSFWVIHPTLERLYHAKLMTGGFSDTTWPTDSEGYFICSGSYCKDYESESDERGFFDSCCEGHYEESRLLNGFIGDRSDKIGVSNGVTMTGTDPRSAAYSNSFIYDNFEWDHCYGPSDINALLKSQYKKSVSS